jgi:PAS domain S-box-containing protein
VGVEALELLYRWASNPKFAVDALKLLQELQTHQVELDIQYEEVQRNERQLNEELLHYKALYELAPIPYLMVAKDGQILESNQAAARLFGYDAAQRLEGCYLNEFLALSNRMSVASLLQNMDVLTSEISRIATLSAGPDEGRRLILKARPGPVADHLLMVLSPESRASEP